MICLYCCFCYEENKKHENSTALGYKEQNIKGYKRQQKQEDSNITHFCDSCIEFVCEVEDLTYLGG